MSDTLRGRMRGADVETRGPAGSGEDPRRRRRVPTRWAAALACGLLGFALVAQVQATEPMGERLEAEREEDLARILADLTAEGDRLQTEITDLRLLLIEFETSAETEELALRNLERRVRDLQVLAGTVPAEGEGVHFVIDDPAGEMSQELLVDTVQELRDAGAEAISVDGVRLVASSAFTTRNQRLLIDDRPLSSPYRIVAIGPAETMAAALAIPGGAVDSVERSMQQATTSVETRAQVSVPARDEPHDFVFGRAVAPEEE